MAQADFLSRRVLGQYGLPLAGNSTMHPCEHSANRRSHQTTFGCMFVSSVIVSMYIAYNSCSEYFAEFVIRRLVACLHEFSLACHACSEYLVPFVIR